MSKHYIVSAALTALILVGAGCAATEQAAAPEAAAPPPADGSVQVPAAGGTEVRVAPTGETRTFEVVADNFSFSLKEIRVKAGDKVKIVFTNAEGFHDWKIDEFNAATQQIAAGSSETIEFLADMAGTFEYYCSVGRHRAMGMVGDLIVE